MQYRLTKHMNLGVIGRALTDGARLDAGAPSHAEECRMSNARRTAAATTCSQRSRRM
jgi:hypothetical protein